jgi:stearoyl-CoA desaturase (delta-9 desaturase)
MLVKVVSLFSCVSGFGTDQSGTINQVSNMSTCEPFPAYQEKDELPPNNNPAQQKHVPWYKQLDWLMVTMVILVPTFAGLSTIWVPFQRKTQIMAFFYSLMKGFSITGGMPL